MYTKWQVCISVRRGPPSFPPSPHHRLRAGGPRGCAKLPRSPPGPGVLPADGSQSASRPAIPLSRWDLLRDGRCPVTSPCRRSRPGLLASTQWDSGRAFPAPELLLNSAEVSLVPRWPFSTTSARSCLPYSTSWGPRRPGKGLYQLARKPSLRAAALDAEVVPVRWSRLEPRVRSARSGVQAARPHTSALWALCSKWPPPQWTLVPSCPQALRGPDRLLATLQFPEDPHLYLDHQKLHGTGFLTQTLTSSLGAWESCMSHRDWLMLPLWKECPSH